MSGKGSAPRPFTDRERFEDNWAAIDWTAREQAATEPPSKDEDAKDG